MFEDAMRIKRKSGAHSNMENVFTEHQPHHQQTAGTIKGQKINSKTKLKFEWNKMSTPFYRIERH